ncbi:Golgi SNAP receptor complex member 2 [Galdieria sulphuraria]|uniref:Golgi SNAP receptor complex member 2 n=1 Tax=Galdieria sulphuraria TaxID=130081 RepID=M2XYR2_GALSU|nr:Golgi SNAP receptor complex member 2 [Galdieria sulphuraria]EME28634.1 Golgi SNAP receptor complex member 2 [Galdieria sulphuraria]GJD10735.1 Golgi SNAP receptor complex member 2 [Galdieria sulphuraria]|eukprot:XP_005705154.1 Golgi SNAP receptor complex member 2 [Galdieria sulphuraria]
MEGLYLDARKLVLESRDLLDSIETGRENSTQCQTYLSQKINRLTRTLQQLSTLALREPSSRREAWQLKIDRLNSDSLDIRAAFENYLSRSYTAAIQAKEREELLDRYSGKDTSIVIDSFQTESQSLHRSNVTTEGILGMGQATLHALSLQRSRLKGAKKRMLDVANVLGISHSVIRMIEGREKVDAYIVYGGMFFIILIVFGIYIWKKVYG